MGFNSGLKGLIMNCEYHFEGLESVWRALLSGHVKSLSRYFLLKIINAIK
jgi:hypothetical protein